MKKFKFKTLCTQLGFSKESGYSVAKKFKDLTSKRDQIASNACFIIDDTPNCRIGNKIENVSIIHDHANMKNKRQKGFKNLVLALFDGKSTIPLDYSVHSEKLFSLKQRKQQYKKECVKNVKLIK